MKGYNYMPVPPVPGKEVPIISGFENQQGLWLSEMKAFGVPGIPLKTPVHRLTQPYSLWAPTLGQQLERHQEHTGGTELSGIGVRSEGAAFSQTEVLAEAIVLLLSSPTDSVGRHHI